MLRNRLSRLRKMEVGEKGAKGNENRSWSGAKRLFSSLVVLESIEESIALKPLSFLRYRLRILARAKRATFVPVFLTRTDDDFQLTTLCDPPLFRKV